MKKLHPLFRLAVISGVEAAVRLHIRRGDDLNARDKDGATPLILAAGKNRVGIARLLLEAGADAELVDLNGMDALAHARKSGGLELNSLLTTRGPQAQIFVTPESPDSTLSVVLLPRAKEDFPAALVVPAASFTAQLQSDGESPVEVVLSEAPMTREPDIAEGAAQTKPALAAVPPVALILAASHDDEWEAEEESVAPEGDESVSEESRLVLESIARHKPVDRDEEWEDVELHLPIRSAPLVGDDSDGKVRRLLFAAMREGMISVGELEDVCSNADGSRNEDAERLLSVVIGELGATVVEWTGRDRAPLSAPSIEEEHLLMEAMEFVEDLGSGRNEPFRFYSKDVRGDLLDAEEEILLGREMEEAGLEALRILAQWPTALATLYAAADRVARGEADPDLFSLGPEPSSEEEPSELVASEEDDVKLSASSHAFVSAVEAVRKAEGERLRLENALIDVRLTRGFLLGLAEMERTDLAGREFSYALQRQSAARERMTVCNLRLAFSIAKKYMGSGIPIDDLVQEANIGLMKAVERYDWRRGFRFSTYATWWIRQQVSRFIADSARVVRPPVHVQEAARKLLKERTQVEAGLMRPESELETALRVGMAPDKVRLLLSIFDEIVSLDEADSGNVMSSAEMLIAQDDADPARALELKSLRATLVGMLDEFDERTRKVIVLRFGFEDQEEMTLEEVGQHLGVTRERVRQIESKAIGRLRHVARRDVLAYFMEGKPFSPVRRVIEVTHANKEGPPHETIPALASTSDKPSTIEHHHEVFEIGDPVSRLVDDALRLGLKVTDRRAEGGDTRIVVPYDSRPAVRALGRRLIVYGFSKIYGDVFAK